MKDTYEQLNTVVSASIRKTMNEGESVHGPGKWMTQSKEFHLNRALKHIADYLLHKDPEDLEHALCRVGMAKYQAPQ